MSRPLHRGFSGGGRLSENIQEFLEDSQMKFKPEKEDSDKNRLLSPDLVSSWNPFQSIYTINSPSKQSVPEKCYIVPDPYSPVSSRKRYKLTLFLLKLSLFVIVILALTGSFWWTISLTTASRSHTFRGYRRLQEQLVSDLWDIGELSLGSSRIKESEFCSLESENYVPCFNVTENLELGLTEGQEQDRRCGPTSKQNCLVLAPSGYKIPHRWPTGRDVIWIDNVKINAQEVLSSGTLTKRMMLLDDDQISFSFASSMVDDNIEDYSHQIAEMIGLRNESYLVQAGDWDGQNPSQIITELCGFVTILSGTFLLHKTKDMVDGQIPLSVRSAKHVDDEKDGVDEESIPLTLRRQDTSSCIRSP